MDAYAAAMPSPPAIAMGVDKLSYEIFSLLESKFLFGAADGCLSSGPGTPVRVFLDSGCVRVLAIDGSAATLTRLEPGR